MSKTERDGHSLSVVQTAAVMAVMTLASKGLGFVRELVLASNFGTSYIVDAYVMAQNITGILLGGVLGAVSTAYMPLYSEAVERQGFQAGKRFTDQILTIILLIATVAAVLGCLFAGQIVSVLRYDAETAALTGFYLRFAFIDICMTSVTGIATAYLHYSEDFFRPIMAGYLFDAFAIGFILFSARTSHYYLIFGLLAGHFAQMVWIFAAAGRKKYRYHPNFGRGDATRRIFALAIPVFIGSTITQINSLIDSLLASGLPRGRVAGLNYGSKFSAMLLALSATIIGTIFYPKLAKAVSMGDWDFFNSAARKCLTVALMITIPFSLGALVFAEPVIQVFFERGAFNDASTGLTADTFRFYSAGIAFSAAAGLYVNIFNSLQEVRVPMACGAAGVVCNIALDFAMIGPLQHRGLALATSIAAAVNCIMLAVTFKKRHRDLTVLPPRKTMAAICGAAALSVLLAVLVYKAAQLVWMPRMAYLFLAVAAAVAAYLLLLKLWRVEEVDVLKELWRRV